MATDRSESVTIQGLKEFLAALKAVDLNKDLAQANKKAAEMVAAKARGKAESLGSVLAKAAPSIKAAAQQRQAAINLGGSQYPFALGAEFGGGRRPTTRQFKPWLGHTGYALYPTIRETREQFIDVYADAIDELMRRAFPD